MQTRVYGASEDLTVVERLGVNGAISLNGAEKLGDEDDTHGIWHNVFER